MNQRTTIRSACRQLANRGALAATVRPGRFTPGGAVDVWLSVIESGGVYGLAVCRRGPGSMRRRIARASHMLRRVDEIDEWLEGVTLAGAGGGRALAEGGR